MNRKELQNLIALLLTVTLAAGLIYLSGCAPAAQQQRQANPEREKAIQDSLQKLYIYELNKAWSTGYEYYKPKIYSRAIKPFWKIIEIDTIARFKDVYALLSDCYFQLGIADSAQMVLEMGIEKYPEMAGLRRNLAWIYTEKEMIDEAITQYEKVVDLVGANADDWKRVGNLYVRNNRAEDAITAYQKVVELDPADKESQQTLAQLLKTTGDIDAIREALTKSKDINKPETIFNLAKFYYDQQEFANAIVEFTAYLTKRPDDYVAMEYLGGSYYGKGDYRSAITTYKKIADAKPNEKKIYADIATNYRLLGDLTTARTYVRKAFSVDSKYGLAYLVLGEVYETAVEQCLSSTNKKSPKFEDKLVYREAYRQYQAAARDLEFQDDAERKMNYLKDFLPTNEDEFFNKGKKTASGKYQITESCYKWIGSEL